MKNSALYRIHPKEKYLQAVKEIEFSDFNFKERYDIQEWVESTPEILGEKLLIVSKELSYFSDTRERPDLIAIDKLGNLVIIELKRDDSGTNVEWQAIKYASYISKFKPEDILQIYSRYLQKRKNGDDEIEPSTAEQQILEFIEEDSIDEINKKQRLILVSHRFAKEVTSAINWLVSNYKIEIRCVQLIPYYDQDKETYYLESQLILPLPGLDDLIITAAGGIDITKSVSSGPVRKDDEFTAFLSGIKDEIANKIKRELIPSRFSRWAGVGKTFRYYHLWYNHDFWDNWSFSYKIWIFNEIEKRSDRKNKIGLFIDISKKHLLNYGASELKIQELKIFLQDSELKDFNFKTLEGSGSFWLEKYIGRNSLSDSTKFEVIKGMIDLIEFTKPEIDRLLLS